MAYMLMETHPPSKKMTLEVYRKPSILGTVPEICWVIFGWAILGITWRRPIVVNSPWSWAV